MRLLFLLLLAANLALFAWFQQSAQQEAPPQPPRPGPGSLTLVSEAEIPKPDTPSPSPELPEPDPERQEEVEPEQQQLVQPVSPFQFLACYQSAPFPSREAAEGLASALAGHWRIEETDNREQLGYWVYLPSLDSLEEALERVAELQDDGITDVSVVRAGTQENAISLGIFSAEQRAVQRQQQLAERGVQAERGIRYRGAIEYRVLLMTMDFDLPPDAGEWNGIDCQQWAE